jgi:hypothetical protein
VQYGHNSTVIGSVDVVAAGRDGWWYADATIDTGHLTDDAVVLERIRVGAPISVGFDPIHSDDDLHLRLRRHDLAQLRHIAVLRRGEIPAFAGAKIIAVTESKRATITKTESGTVTKPKPATTSGVDWRGKLPASHRDFANLSDEMVVRDRFTLTNRHGSIRWDGKRFVMAAGRRLAA